MCTLIHNTQYPIDMLKLLTIMRGPDTSTLTRLEQDTRSMYRTHRLTVLITACTLYAPLHITTVIPYIIFSTHGPYLDFISDLLCFSKTTNAKLTHTIPFKTLEQLRPSV